MMAKMKMMKTEEQEEWIQIRAHTQTNQLATRLRRQKLKSIDVTSG
jgi:hypothetical protein